MYLSRRDEEIIARHEAWWLEDNRPEPAVAGHCACCGGKITEGEEVYTDGSDYFCTDCVERIDICEEDDGTLIVDDDRFAHIHECECGTKLEDISDSEILVVDGNIYCGECLYKVTAEAEEPYDPRCEPEYYEDR